MKTLISREIIHKVLHAQHPIFLINFITQLIQMIKQRRRKVDELAQIRDPEKVRVLILTEQKVSMKDFFFIRNFSRLKKMDLSYNKLSGFPVGFSFSCFTELSILYLHYNKFNQIKNLLPLADCKHLEYLTLFGNSLEEAKTRHFMLNQIPTLKLMDDKIIKLEERASELFDQRKPVMKITFPLVTSLESDDSSTFLAAVIAQLFLIRKAYLESNPILRIQRYWRSKFKKIKGKKQIRIVTKEPAMNKEESKKRLITEKLPIHRSQEQRILSVFAMNLTFWTSIKKMCSGKVFALRQQCVRNDLPFIQLSGLEEKRTYLALRVPQIASNKAFLQFFIDTASMFTLRKVSPGSLRTNQKIPSYLPENSTKSKYKLSQTEQEKYLKVQEKMRKVEQRYWKDVVILDMPPERKHTILKNMYLKSQGKNKMYPFCFEDNISRAVSAISIQRLWRGYQVRKTHPMKRMILENRSAVKIQKWIRNQSFQHRHKFLIYVRQYIKNQNSKSLVIPTSLLHDLDRYNKNLNMYKLMVIPFQTSALVFRGNSVEIVSQRKPYPSYLNQYLSISWTEQSLSQSQSNLVEDILFRNCCKINYITDKKQTLVQFLYDSVLETRNRKFLLALKTYNMKNHSFVQSLSIDSNKQFPQVKCINDAIRDQLIVASNRNRLPPNLQGLNWKKLKIRYYNGREDHSCLIRVAAMNPEQAEQSDTRSKPRKNLRKNHETTIARSYMALQQIVTSPSESQRYTEHHHQLTTDKSLNWILNFRDHSQDTIGLQSLAETLNQKGLDYKRSRVHDIKLGHKERIATLSQNRQDHLKKLRKYILQDDEKNSKLIEEKRADDYIQKIRRYNRVRESSHKIDDSFQKEFLTRGNRSMKIELLRFERQMNMLKSSPTTSRKKMNPILNSLQSERISSDIRKQRLGNKNYLTTQIKEFSINYSSKEDPGFGKLDSVNDKFKEILEKDNSKRLDQVRQENSDDQKSEIRKSKKQRKLLHSSFPEEHYPLKEGNKLGFQLPKLKLRK